MEDKKRVIDYKRESFAEIGNLRLKCLVTLFELTKPRSSKIQKAQSLNYKSNIKFIQKRRQTKSTPKRTDYLGRGGGQFMTHSGERLYRIEHPNIRHTGNGFWR